MNKHTAYDLAQMQSLPLEAKIRMTQHRIEGWYNHYDGNVYVSFSGGKDSTVLLDICRKLYPNIPAVFVDTGLEYPEIKEFVKTFEFKNLTVLRPKMSFRQVIEKHGYPLISKDAALKIYYARAAYKRGDMAQYKRYLGLRSKDGEPERYFNKLSRLSMKILESDIPVSDKCCRVMKEAPLDEWQHKNKVKPIIGILVEESDRRKQRWQRVGCNAFQTSRPNSAPLSFWTKQDILLYIKENHLPIASVYGDIVEVNGKLRTTGADRTGCVFCMFGAHLEKSPNRFERLRQTHLQLWEYCMKPWNEGGLGLKEVCDFCGIRTGC